MGPNLLPCYCLRKVDREVAFGVFAKVNALYAFLGLYRNDRQIPEISKSVDRMIFILTAGGPGQAIMHQITEIGANFPLWKLRNCVVSSQLYLREALHR